MKTSLQESKSKSSVAPILKKGQEIFFGNKSFFNSNTIQPKLTIGRQNDPYEKEADAMADKVVQRLSNKNSIQTKPVGHTISDLVQKKCASCEEEEKVQKKEADKENEEELQRKPIFESLTQGEEKVQRKCAECEREEILQRKGENEHLPSSSPSVERTLAASKGSGAPLPEATRAAMESSFGADLSGVKIHTGSTAVQMNKDLHAQAFTHGNDIYFNEGKFSPSSASGKHLLAHELTHVIQQQAADLSIQKSCDPAVSTCPPVNASLPPAAQAQSGEATKVLVKVAPLSEGDKTNLKNAFGGAPLLTYITQRDQKRNELKGKNDELLKIKPENGVPEQGSELEQKISKLTAEIEALNLDITKLDNLVKVGIEALGLTDEAQLTTLINDTFPKLFIRRAKDIAKVELDKNKFIVEEEAKRYGYLASVDTTAKKGLIAAANDLVTRKKSIANSEQLLRSISTKVPSAGLPSAETMGSDYYDYVNLPPKIAKERTELEKTHSGYLLRYPILARPNLNLEEIATGDEEKVGNALNAEVSTIIKNIETTKANIDSEKLKVWDLKNIIAMTSADMAINDNPDLMAVVDKHIKGIVSDEETLQMALTALAITAAIVATVATAGGALVVGGAAAGVGLGLSIGEAANSVQQYLAESAAKDTALDPALGDISLKDPDLTWVIMSLVGVGLDVLQVKTIFTAVRGAAKTLKAAEDVVKLGNLAKAAGASAIAAERLMTSGSNQLLRLALKETATQVGSAIAMQALANEFMGNEDTELGITTVQLDLPDKEEVTTAGTPGVQLQPMPLPAWVPPSLPHGAQFEGTIEGMLRRGTVPGLPQMDHVIYAPHNKSGHGIDFFAMRVHPESGTVFLYRIEVKGGIAPNMGKTLRGPQGGKAWTLNAIEKMMDNARIRGLIETRLGYKVGDSVNDPKVRAQILRRLRTAPSFVIAHSSAFLGRLGSTVGGMKSKGSPYAPKKIIRVP